MKEFLHYWKHCLILLILLSISFAAIQAQDQPSFEFKIQILEPDEDNGLNVWGVYVKPTGGFVDGMNTTLTASGQVTILMNNTADRDSIENIQSVNGTWEDAGEYGKFRDDDPAAPAIDDAYFFVGLIDEGDGIPLEDNKETLLFTFQATQDCPDELGLFDNIANPHIADFEAMRLNPGMDLAVINKSTGVIHNWGGNYSPNSFSCEDCDMDGIPDGIEDSNGDGMYTPPIAGVAQDSSDMCDACDPLGIKNFAAELTGGDTTAICRDPRNPYSAGLVVTTTGGEAPFTLYLNAATATDPLGKFVETIPESGDTFYVSPSETTTYKLDSIVDKLGCRLDDLSKLQGEVTITVEGPLTFAADGNNLSDAPVTSCTLDTLRIGIKVESETDGEIIYQWQSSPDGGTTFTDIRNGTPYSDADTDTLVISNPDGLNDIQYRAIISTAACDQLDMVSDTATLRVEGPFVVNTSPTDETICGDATSHTITASTDNLGSGTINRTWQVQDGTGWKNIEDIVDGSGVIGDVEYSDTDTDVLNIAPANTSANLSGLNDYWYRLQISGTGGYCTEVVTDSARLTVEGPLLNGGNEYPKSTETCAGETACFNVKIENPGSGTVEYQWQYKTADPSSPWSNLTNGTENGYSGVRSDTMCIANAVGLDGYRFQVNIKLGECAEINTSELADGPDTLFVNEPISFTLQPQGESVCGGNATTFSVVIADNGDTGFTQKWEMSKDTGKTWVDVVDDGAIFTGVATPDLAVNTASILAPADLDTLNGRLFRVAVTSASCLSEVFSREAELRLQVIDTLNTIDPRDTTVCSGEPAYFVVDVPYNRDTQELFYQWQIKHPIDLNWIDLDDVGDYNGVKTPRFSISDVNGFNGMEFRASISTVKCAGFYNTKGATLTVEGPFVFGAENDGHPQDTTICHGTPVTFKANPVVDLTTKNPFGADNPGAGTLSYNWVFNRFGEYNNPARVDTAVWALSGGASGTDGTTLTITNTDDLEGYAFWLEVTSMECQDNPTESLPAILHIDGPLRIVTDPMSTSNCADAGAIFAAAIENDGYGGAQSIVYRWQEKSPTGTWDDIQNGGVYNGATTDTLSIDELNGLNDYEYALVATTVNGCSSVTTASALLETVGPIDVIKDPVDIDTCSGQSGFFAATVIDSTTLDESTLNFIWQLSKNGGVDWSNIDSSVDAVYSTETTDTLNVADVTGLNGYYYRLATTIKPAVGLCDTVFSQTARIRAEGPIMYQSIADLGAICQNEGTTINARIDVANTGPGVPQLQWEYRVSSTSGAFAPLTNGGIYDATTTNQLFIDSVLYINGYQYRLAGTTEKCKETNTSFYSDTITILTQSDTLLMCDYDLDGIPNGDNYGDPDNPIYDFDDDNDGLPDSIEIYITNSGIDSLSSFDSNTPVVGTDMKTFLNDSEKDSDNDTINNGEETDDDDGVGGATDDDVFNGDPTDPCDPILSPACVGVAIDIRIKLQGAMIGQAAGDLMRDDLRTSIGGSLIPNEEPYSGMYVQRLGTDAPGELAFEHVDDHQNEENGKLKGGGEIADADLLDNQPVSDNDIVDWVFVELRSGLQLDSVIATRSALLQRDGDVRDTDVATADDIAKGWVDAQNYKYLTFDSTLAGPYYISVRHRNHLGVMTNEAGELSPKITKINFADPQTNALGVHPQKMLLSGTDSLEQQLWAGDLNSDGKVIYQGAQNDVYEMFANVFRADGNDDGKDGDPLDNFILTAYKRSDYNLDGNTIYQGPQNDRQMLIFNTILSFPDNQEHLLANYVILEQLP